MKPLATVLTTFALASLSFGGRAAEIDESRALLAELQSALTASSPAVQVRRFADCPPGEPDERRLLLAPDGQPRAYADRYGSGDALIRRSHGYDAAGQLRAARIEARAASGAQRVYELALDAQGRVLQRAQRLYPGPGWSFPDDWDAADLVRDPRAAFAAASACASETPAPR